MSVFGKGDNFDARIKLENEAMDDLFPKLASKGIDSYAEMFARLRAVNRAKWAIDEANRLNRKLHEGFEASEIIDLKVLTELIGVGSHHHDVMGAWQQKGYINKKWHPIDTADAFCVSSGLTALCTKEGVPMGRKVLDLGGGDGTWGFVLAQLGFDTTLIERDPSLVDQFQVEKQELERNGIKTGKIKIINGEFSTIDSKNTAEIRDTLRNADVMTCYPWPDEIPDRLKLFQQYGKKGALMVMYGGPLDGFGIDLDQIKELGLEVVSREINDMLSEGKGKFVRGYDTPSFGASWVVLRKA